MTLVTLQGNPISRLGLAAQQRMEVGCVDLAYQAGINYFFSYGLGKGPFVEEVRSHLAQHRESLLVATGSESRTLSEVEAQLEKARHRFDVDTIDVFFAEYVAPDDDWTQVEGLLEKLHTWKTQGLIRYVGASTHNRPVALQLIEQAHCDVLMHRYNMAHRGAEATVLPAAQATEKPVIAFTSTRWSTLLKGHPDWSEAPPTAADCYRFVLSHPAVTVALTSPKTQADLKDNLKALTSPVLSPTELAHWQSYGDLVYGQGQDAFDTSWP
ncbi:MAG TPA: aldo/keto reductase [Trichocoleus sp.]